MLIVPEAGVEIEGDLIAKFRRNVEKKDLQELVRVSCTADLLCSFAAYAECLSRARLTCVHVCC